MVMNLSIEKVTTNALKEIEEWKSKPNETFFIDCVNNRLNSNLSKYKAILSKSLENLKLYDEFNILRRI